jgi:hypothetical protein
MAEGMSLRMIHVLITPISDLDETLDFEILS